MIASMRMPAGSLLHNRSTVATPAMVTIQAAVLIERVGRCRLRTHPASSIATASPATHKIVALLCGE
jgi:hypothetical protein